MCIGNELQAALNSQCIGINQLSKPRNVQLHVDTGVEVLHRFRSQLWSIFLKPVRRVEQRCASRVWQHPRNQTVRWHHGWRGFTRTHNDQHAWKRHEKNPSVVAVCTT